MIGFFDFLMLNREPLFIDTLAHGQTLLTALLIAAVISITLGLAVYRYEAAAEAVLAVASALLTIPSFAMFAVLLPIFGLGFTSTVVALVIYAQLPILRNTIVGLRSVDPAVIESARGMGFGRRRILTRIEMPIAWPVIVAGARVSLLLIAGILAIASYVGGPGLGEWIFSGLARQGGADAINSVLAGMLLIIVLALVLDTLLALVGRLTTSKGIYSG